MVVSDKFFYGSNLETYLILRLEKDSDDSVDALSSYSVFEKLIYFGTEVLFSLDEHNLSKATQDQIKKLELEEMKAGKKWTGNGYEDWLTYDDLTLNELLEHDLSEIEINPLHGQWSVVYECTKDELIDFAIADYDNEIKALRLKPQESFVDVAINWKVNAPYFIDLDKISDRDNNLESWVVGVPRYGWVLSRFIFPNKSKHDSSILFQNDYKEIMDKATHARFIKVSA